MRRQAGASTVDLDTLKGIAEYTIAQPMTLDFAMVERAGFVTINQWSKGGFALTLAEAR